MTRSEAIAAYDLAKERGDTRGMHKAEDAARKALHAILSNPPSASRMQRLRAVLMGGRNG